MKVFYKNGESLLTRAVTLLGFAIMLLGLLVLTGWISGRHILTSFVHGYIPMATSTAISTVLFGFILFSGAHKPAAGLRKQLATVIIGIVSQNEKR